jgi:hypothetical protein
MGLPIRKNTRPAPKWCKQCGRKHSRGNCLLVADTVEVGGKILVRYRDIDNASQEAIETGLS